MNKQQSPAIDEINVFHPLVESWLKSNGYSYVHEYKMPDFGRIDFFAKKGKTKLLIECKCEKTKVRKAIIQVAAYRLQIPECNAAIAIPIGWASKHVHAVAARYEVAIIEIEVPEQNEIVDYSEGVTWTREYNDTVATKEDWLEILDYITTHPDEALAERIRYSLNMLILRSINQAYNDEIIKALASLIKFPPSGKDKE